MDMKIIVAMSDGNRGIGKDRKLPWPRIQEDLDFYKRSVLFREDPAKKNVIIQGRFGWEIGFAERKSSDYINIVISSTLDGSADPYHPVVVSSFHQAVEYASKPEILQQTNAIWIVGGQRIYEEAIAHPLSTTLYLTRIFKDFDCDTFFPRFEHNFVITSDPEVDDSMKEDKGIRYRFEVYKRK